MRDGWTVNHTFFSIYNEREKKITGLTLLALDADIVALQEVENLDTLKKFRTEYLGGRQSYPYAMVVDGNDPRRIDLALLSRYPITSVQTHAHLWSSELHWYLFPRDCLVAEVELPGAMTLTLFINHLKSMLDKDDPDNGRRNTRRKREIQAQAVRQIVTARFGQEPWAHPFIILGDFNDYMEVDDQGEPGIGALVEWDQVVNVVDRIPQDERWTHYYKGRTGVPAAYRQLDYLLPSKSLAERNPQPPHIERRGLPKRADRYDGERFTGVGKNTPKASDHCPVVFELQF